MLLAFTEPLHRFSVETVDIPTADTYTCYAEDSSGGTLPLW